jgi:hypothetical protein
MAETNHLQSVLQTRPLARSYTACVLSNTNLNVSLRACNRNSSVFWVTTRHKVVWNRRFGTIGPIFKGQAVLTLGQLEPWWWEPKGSPETSVSNHLTPRNCPENGTIQVTRDGVLGEVPGSKRFLRLRAKRSCSGTERTIYLMTRYHRFPHRTASASKHLHLVHVTSHVTCPQDLNFLSLHEAISDYRQREVLWVRISVRLRPYLLRFRCFYRV